MQLPTGDRLQIPTGAETLRLQSYLVLCRNSRADYVQLAELVDANGLENAAVVLAGIDRYYSSGQASAQPGRQWIATQLVRRLADPMPSDDGDPTGTPALGWDTVRQTCLNLAVAILEEAS